jgi:hypothetical protein
MRAREIATVVVAILGIGGCTPDRRYSPPEKQTPLDSEPTDPTDHNPNTTPEPLCNPNYIGGDSACDCGCEVVDPDCADNGVEGCSEVGCSAPGCDYCYDPVLGDSAECTVDGWSCDVSFYDDGYCDCGCGTEDPDCAGVGGGCSDPGCEAAECEYCSLDGSYTDVCGAEPRDTPDGWICDPSYYEDGVCDCGCGALDVDCDGDGCAEPNCKTAACVYCSNGAGSVTLCN